jgi:hypothetical protein
MFIARVTTVSFQCNYQVAIGNREIRIIVYASYSPVYKEMFLQHPIISIIMFSCCHEMYDFCVTKYTTLYHVDSSFRNSTY